MPREEQSKIINDDAGPRVNVSVGGTGFGNPFGLPVMHRKRLHIAANGTLARRPIPADVTPYVINLELYRLKLQRKDPSEDWRSRELYEFDRDGYEAALEDAVEERWARDTSVLRDYVDGAWKISSAVCRHYGSDIRIFVRRTVDARDKNKSFYTGFIGAYPTYGTIAISRDDNGEEYILFTPDEDCPERIFVCTALHSRLRCIPVNVDVDEVRWYIPFWYQHRATECEWLYTMFWQPLEPSAPEALQRARPKPKSV